MKQTPAQKIFAELFRLIDFELLKQNSILRYQASGFMPLVIELLAEDTISMTHYYKSNGDMVCDPDMTIQMDWNQKTAHPLSYQDSYRYQDVRGEAGEIDKVLQRSLSSFLLQWIQNIKSQGFFNQ